MVSTTTPALDLAGQLWAADLAYLTAVEQYWATGLDLPDTDPRVAHLLDLGDQCLDLIDELEQRAGHALAIRLNDLATSPELELIPDVTTAAAVLRVFATDLYIADAEALQPGRELPAVGIWADLTD
ncbi:hypothetical protein CC117_00695 [Parafrankia colletiae]|uniref:Uncharacterized protein n=1 Tax=Parafrankia colletiae TaxID=573497 RepID=A0A1S1RJI5_9ACTN|nr:hypothetical protein [Parafrankia colletiae]MCK9904354.1 hypothetical protein [Frankia sp. Cpl3]OHV46207.1 hypothetical protein CC117_00695 [Parafrankia colletiae]